MEIVLLWVCPLVGSVVCGIASLRGSKGEKAELLSVSMIGLSLLVALKSAIDIVNGVEKEVRIAKWIGSEVMEVNWGIRVDSLTGVMLVVILGISLCVHIYSREYMRGDEGKMRFFVYIGLFTLLMEVLVVGENYLQLFVGWEGVGVCSYLLISYWNTRIQASKAAVQAMLVNRVGDVGLALGIMLIYKECRSVDYGVVFNMGEMIDQRTLLLVSVLLTIGAVGKSAQMGLHIWLPNAMEGPTPVSALIHAATMVTAGVYLIARSSPLLEETSEGLMLIGLIGGATSLMAGTIGLVQNDLKRVVAYSTASQLGYMVSICGLSSYDVGIFHLANHAVFKALLFLSAGSVIHGIMDEQDMRRMGGLGKIMPLTYGLTLIGSIALVGGPFLTGYYSKDVILELAYTRGSFGDRVGVACYGMGMLGAVCTSFYTVRVLYSVYLSETRMHRAVMEGAHEGGWNMKGVMIALGVGSVVVGYLLKEALIGIGTDFWRNALYMKSVERVESEELGYVVKLLPLCMGLIGGGLALSLYLANRDVVYRWKTSVLGRRVYKFLSERWFFDRVYNAWIAQGYLRMGYEKTYKVVDKGINEVFVGGRGGGWLVAQLPLRQSGRVNEYIVRMLVGVGVIMAIMMTI